MGPGGRRSRTPARRLRACNRACMDAARRRGFRAREVGTGVAPIVISMRTALLACCSYCLHLVLALRQATVDDICSLPDVSQGNKPCACTSAPNQCQVNRMAILDLALDARLRRARAHADALAPSSTLGTGGTLTIIAAVDRSRRRAAGCSPPGEASRSRRPATSTSAGAATSVARIDVAGDGSSSMTSRRRPATSSSKASSIASTRGRRVRAGTSPSPPGAPRWAPGAVTMPGNVTILGETSTSRREHGGGREPHAPRDRRNVAVTGEIDASGGDNSAASRSISRRRQRRRRAATSICRLRRRRRRRRPRYRGRTAPSR